jgi:hypothetical protein
MALTASHQQSLKTTIYDALRNVMPGRFNGESVAQDVEQCLASNAAE